MKTEYEDISSAKKRSQKQQQMTLAMIILAANSSLFPLWALMGAFAFVMLFAIISFIAAVFRRRVALAQTAARMNASVGSITRVFPLTILIFAMVTLAGCLNAEREKYPLDWSRKSTLTELRQLEGTYANLSMTVEENTVVESLEKLWYFLTRQDVEGSEGVHVRLTVADDDTLLAELLDAAGLTLSSVRLEPGRGYTWKDDSLRLAPESGFAYDALGGGFTTGTCRLRRAENGGLVGETDGIGAGLFLHIIPAMGVGNDWYFWKKLNEHPEWSSARHVTCPPNTAR